MFHLQNIYPTTNWKDDYSESQKVILYATFPSYTALTFTDPNPFNLLSFITSYISLIRNLNRFSYFVLKLKVI